MSAFLLRTPRVQSDPATREAEQVKEGRLREWQDQIGHEAFEAEKKAAAAEAGRAKEEGR